MSITQIPPLLGDEVVQYVLHGKCVSFISCSPLVRATEAISRMQFADSLHKLN